MSFWSSLLKGATSLIPGVGPLISAGLDVAGGIGGGMSADRQQQNNAAQQAAQFGLQESRTAEDALMNRQGLDLRQRQFGQDSQSDAYKKAIMGALATNMRDVTANRPEGIPTISFGGGARPSAIGQQGRDAGTELNRQAMAKLIGGEKFDELQPIERLQPAEHKSAGFFENLLGGAGAVGKALSGGQAIQQQSDFQKRIQELIQQLSQGQSQGPQAISSKDEEFR